MVELPISLRLIPSSTHLSALSLRLVEQCWISHTTNLAFSKRDVATTFYQRGEPLLTSYLAYGTSQHYTTGTKPKVFSFSHETNHFLCDIYRVVMILHHCLITSSPSPLCLESQSNFAVYFTSGTGATPIQDPATAAQADSLLQAGASIQLDLGPESPVVKQSATPRGG